MVGYRKNRWTAEEEEALLAGIVKYGTGKWIDIVEDPQFSAQLFYRTNIDLKDKWRNIKEKSKTQTLKSVKISPVVSNNDMSNQSRCDATVFEAISTINDEYGSDLSGILSYIEERYELPQNSRKLLSDSLGILVSQGKLEKVLNRYKISDVENKVLEVAAEEVATRLAEAENKEFIASEAIKEAERIHKLAKESKLMLHISLDIHEQCALGEKVFFLD